MDLVPSYFTRRRCQTRTGGPTWPPGHNLNSGSQESFWWRSWVAFTHLGRLLRASNLQGASENNFWFLVKAEVALINLPEMFQVTQRSLSERRSGGEGSIIWFNYRWLFGIPHLEGATHCTMGGEWTTFTQRNYCSGETTKVQKKNCSIWKKDNKISPV